MWMCSIGLFIYTYMNGRYQNVCVTDNLAS